MAGGGKGGLWKAQRVPTEPWHMGQYGYNQVSPLTPHHTPPLCLQQAGWYSTFLYQLLEE